jgi:hypothetical protein
VGSISKLGRSSRRLLPDYRRQIAHSRRSQASIQRRPRNVRCIAIKHHEKHRDGHGVEVNHTSYSDNKLKGSKAMRVSHVQSIDRSKEQDVAMLAIKEYLNDPQTQEYINEKKARGATGKHDLSMDNTLLCPLCSYPMYFDGDHLCRWAGHDIAKRIKARPSISQRVLPKRNS